MSFDTSLSSFDELDDSHKIVLKYTRRLEKATKNVQGRMNSNELFVTSDHRVYMNELARVDPNLLDDIVRQLIINYNKINEPSKNISQLRETFMVELMKAYGNLPGLFDDDEDWEISLSQFDKKFSSSLSVSSSPFQIENPWTTKNLSPTKMPEEYENYVEGKAFLDIYEIIRILKPFGPIGPTKNLWEKIKMSYDVKIHEVLREACKDYFSTLSNVNTFVEMTKLINRNLINIWSLSLKEFPEIGPRVHVLYSGNITLEENNLIITLNPPKLGNSKRYYRLLSSERFLHLKIKDINNFDDNQKSKLKNFLLFPLSLAGRVYEFLYAKSDILYYFATSGLDISNPISIWQVINYNLPIEFNKNMTSSRFFSHMSLGFSKTTPSITFEQKEIRYIKDITINGQCFTDGCAAISSAAMKEIGEILGCHETPSAIQGGIGGAKGVWYIDPCKDLSGNKWIELRESQIKYNHNFDDDFVHLRTLEVLHVACSPTSPGTLNSQFIRVLYNGGVSVNVFLKKMKDYIEKAKSEVVGCDDPHSLIMWVMNNSNVMKRRLGLLHDHFKEESDDENNEIDTSIDLGSEIYALSGFPNSPSEKCIQMLQAGFTPSTCPYLAKNLKVVLSSTLKSFFTKYRVDVPLSRLLICIADPTQTLKPGEVFIQLNSGAGRDERTGLQFGIIEDDVILARNPCRLPSDIVKAKAVKNINLCNYYNVVIFPVNADLVDNVPLATYMSGGDYDGDKIFCCWDPKIVEAYKNSQPSPLDPRVENAFDKNKQTIDTLLSTNSNRIESKLQEIILNSYFEDLETPRDLYDYWHKLQSSEFGMSNEESIYLSQMCAKLIDATKQGLTIKPSVQQRDSEIFRKLSVPYWVGKDRDNKSKINRQESIGGDNFGVKDIMDLLCISIEKEMNKINSKEFSVAEIKTGPDPHIYKFWYNELMRAQQMEEGLYLEDLNLISAYVMQIAQTYNKRYAQTFEDRDKKENEQQSSGHSYKLNEELKSIDYECLKKFLNTPPIEKYKSNIFKLLKDRRSTMTEDPLFMFELQLKAASLYLSSVSKKPDGQACWVIAFRILCNIKSQMLENEQNFFIGGPRSIIDDVWQALKIDQRCLKYNNLN
ncbi:RNA dependent RNA polymerase-domain-containing protein [Glomus cerebriforme]|uniref:RNA-dependent RNA polymerase n=1 Tax=Glomus cerebriforme TaxID=658196 RepID=A0A397TJQ0_9GLOM|nr:RNA dependent RNA polymerase-domain-containing protein [Glomus cerebriforme]